MHKWMCYFISIFSFALLCCAKQPLSAGESNLKIGICDFSQCFLQSELGQFEQERVESMKVQMQKSVSDLESQLQDTQKKLQNRDLLDTLSPKAEEELHQKYRTLQDEMQRVQSQFYQVMQQANMGIMQRMMQAVREASSAVAESLGYSLILTTDSAFHSSSQDDVTDSVIKELNTRFKKEQETLPEVAAPPKGVQ